MVRFDTDGLILVQSRGFVTFIKADLVTAVCVIIVVYNCVIFEGNTIY